MKGPVVVVVGAMRVRPGQWFGMVLGALSALAQLGRCSVAVLLRTYLPLRKPL